MSMLRSAAIVATLLATTAAHAELAYLPGVFKPEPADVATTSDRLDVVGHAGAIQVLAATLSAPVADGTEVLVVHPLLGMAVPARVEKMRVQLPGFLADRRPNHDGVVLVTGATQARFVTLAPAELAAIRATIGKARSLEGVKRALDGLEVGAIDLDGDRHADVVSTYGCTVWGDGRCQVRGQFLLVRHAAAWTILE